MPFQSISLVDLPVDILRIISSFVGDMTHSKSANPQELAIEFPIAVLSRELFDIFRNQVTEIDLAYPDLPNPDSFWSYTLTSSSCTPYVTSLIRGAIRNSNKGLNLFRIPYEYYANQSSYLRMIEAIALHAQTMIDLAVCGFPTTLCHFSSFHRLRSLTLRDVSSEDLDEFDTSIFRLHKLQILDINRILDPPRSHIILKFMRPLIACLEKFRFQFVTSVDGHNRHDWGNVIRRNDLFYIMEHISLSSWLTGLQLKQFHVLDYQRELYHSAYYIRVDPDFGFMTGTVRDDFLFFILLKQRLHLRDFTLHLVNIGWNCEVLTDLANWGYPPEGLVRLSPHLATICVDVDEGAYKVTSVFLDPNVLHNLKHHVRKSILHVRMVQLPHPRHLIDGLQLVPDGCHPTHFNPYFLKTIWRRLSPDSVEEIRAAYSCTSLRLTRNLCKMLYLFGRSIPNVKVLHLSRSFLSNERRWFAGHRLYNSFPRLETLFVHNCSYVETIDNNLSLSNDHLPFFNAIHDFVSRMAEIGKLADYDEAVANSDESSTVANEPSFKTVISQPTLRYCVGGWSSLSEGQPDGVFWLRHRFAEIREKFLLFQIENKTIDVKSILRDLDGLLSETF